MKTWKHVRDTYRQMTTGELLDEYPVPRNGEVVLVARAHLTDEELGTIISLVQDLAEEHQSEADALKREYRGTIMRVVPD